MNELQERAMRLALDALVIHCSFSTRDKPDAMSIGIEAIHALRQALPPVKTYSGGVPNYCTEPEQEPFIYVREDNEKPFGGYEHCSEADAGAFPVYTAPPKREWVGLTHEERDEIDQNCRNQMEALFVVEAKLKEKNT